MSSHETIMARKAEWFGGNNGCLADKAIDAGQMIARRTEWRICSANGWFSVVGTRHRGKNTRQDPPVHDDLVGQHFTASAPNELWLDDITEHRSLEGKLFVCSFKEIFSSRNVGYSIASWMNPALLSKQSIMLLPAAVMSPAASCKPTEDRSFPAASTSPR